MQHQPCLLHWDGLEPVKDILHEESFCLTFPYFLTTSYEYHETLPSVAYLAVPEVLPR